MFGCKNDIEDMVSKDTTHVIVRTEEDLMAHRTLKYLKVRSGCTVEVKSGFTVLLCTYLRWT